MSVVIFIIIFIPINYIIVNYVADIKDRFYMLSIVICAWLIFVPVVLVFDSITPFTDVGDDMGYFFLSNTKINSISDVFDFTRYYGVMEQPGYPWLLSIINMITGHDLVVFKFLNLFIFIVLGVVWYKIGYELEGQVYARRVIVLIMLITPLWYYFIFLLKDMVITLLESLFLLSTIQYSKRHNIASIFSIIFFSLFVLLFRSPLILQNVVVLVMAFIARSFIVESKSRRYTPIVMITVVLLLIIPIVTNYEIMKSIGIYSPERVIGTQEMQESGMRLSQSTEMNRSMFPVLYLFTETAGFSSGTWGTINSSWLRGIMAIPWILFIVPFFIFGFLLLFFPNNVYENKYYQNRSILHSKAIATPWSIIIIYLFISMYVSWIVGDTTRWRLSDMPVIAAISLVGWLNMKNIFRLRIIVWWGTSVLIMFTLYYNL